MRLCSCIFAIVQWYKSCVCVFFFLNFCFSTSFLPYLQYFLSFSACLPFVPFLESVSSSLHSLSAQVCSRHGTHVLTGPFFAACSFLSWCSLPPPLPPPPALLVFFRGGRSPCPQHKKKMLTFFFIALLFHRSSFVSAIKALALFCLWPDCPLCKVIFFFCFYSYSNLFLTASAPPTGHWASTTCFIFLPFIYLSSLNACERLLHSVLVLAL